MLIYTIQEGIFPSDFTQNLFCSSTYDSLLQRKPYQGDFLIFVLFLYLGPDPFLFQLHTETSSQPLLTKFLQSLYLSLMPSAKRHSRINLERIAELLSAQFYLWSYSNKIMRLQILSDKHHKPALSILIQVLQCLSIKCGQHPDFNATLIYSIMCKSMDGRSNFQRAQWSWNNPFLFQAWSDCHMISSKWQIESLHLCLTGRRLVDSIFALLMKKSLLGWVLSRKSQPSWSVSDLLSHFLFLWPRLRWCLWCRDRPGAPTRSGRLGLVLGWSKSTKSVSKFKVSGNI